MFRSSFLQVKAGQKYLDTLSYEDCLELVEVAEEFMVQYPEADFYTTIPVPEVWEKRKVSHIRVVPNEFVEIAWMGGYDHTGIYYRKDPKSGSYTLNAGYHDEKILRLLKDGVWLERERIVWEPCNR